MDPNNHYTKSEIDLLAKNIVGLEREKTDAKKYLKQWIFLSVMSAAFIFSSVLYSINSSRINVLNIKMDTYGDKLFTAVQEIQIKITGMSKDIEYMKNNLELSPNQ